MNEKNIKKVKKDSTEKDLELPPTDGEEKMNLEQLKQFLWKSSDILRGKIDSSDYKKYIFGLLFYKRISDVWKEEYETIVDEYQDKKIARQDHYHRFQVPKDCRWKEIQEQSTNIGPRLNKIFEKLTNVNSPKLDKIFNDIDFANKDKFPNETLQRLINHFSQHDFGDTYISSDLLGDAYEYLIEQFAADAGKKGGEFYTPREVERAIIGILKPNKKDHIYDMAVGSGGFLLEAYHYLKTKESEKVARSLYLYGQEINIGTFPIAKINMFLHGLDSADIRLGDTLADPKFLNQEDSLQTFDICVANPPYSIKEWECEIYKSNKHGRLTGYEMPPKSKADFAFVLHMLKSMKAKKGKAGIVLPHGVLFRGGAEKRIREQIIKNDLIEAIIALPAKLFYGTGIPATILIFNKNKRAESREPRAESREPRAESREPRAESRENKILFINAEADYEEGKNQNRLREEDIAKIVSTFEKFQDIEKYARVVDLAEIEKNDFDLSIRRYIDTTEEEEEIDVSEVWKELQKISKEESENYRRLKKNLEELGY